MLQLLCKSQAQQASEESPARFIIHQTNSWYPSINPLLTVLNNTLNLFANSHTKENNARSWLNHSDKDQGIQFFYHLQSVAKQVMWRTGLKQKIIWCVSFTRVRWNDQVKNWEENTPYLPPAMPRSLCCGPYPQGLAVGPDVGWSPVGQTLDMQGFPLVEAAFLRGLSPVMEQAVHLQQLISR